MHKSLFTIIILALFFQMDSFAQNMPTYYVNHLATGTNDGSTWENAFTDFQMAIDSAAAGDIIWVAEGIYRPNDTIPFFIDKNIELYGGFSGIEMSFDERDYIAYPTILSGDLADDDTPGDFENNRTDNTHTVVLFGENTNNSAVLDGFIVKDGFADGSENIFEGKRGGGIYSFGIPTIQMCAIINNYAEDSGGGLYFFGGIEHGAILKNCLVQNNYAARNGGGIALAFAEEFDLQIDSCLIANNTAGEEGGGLKMHNSEATIHATTFEHNKAFRRGGAIEIRAVFDNLKTLITDCTFEKNMARQGGAIRFQAASGFGVDLAELIITGSEFIENEAVEVDTTENMNQRGGAIHALFRQNSTGALLAIQDCEFEKNSSQRHGSAVHLELQGPDATILVDQCNFTENGSDSTGTFLIEANQIATGNIYLEESSFSNNTTAFRNSGFTISATQFANMTVMATEVLFENNSTEFTGGGLTLNSEDGAELNFTGRYLEILGNAATSYGGGLYSTAGTGKISANFYNCIFDANESNVGAAISAESETNLSFINFDNCAFLNHIESSAAICADGFQSLGMYNCTMTGNEDYGIFLKDASNLTLQNTILNAEDHATFEPFSNEIFVQSLGNNIISDDRLNSWLSPNDFGETDPMLGGMDGLEPQEDSPAIDAGKLPTNPPFADIFGNDRVQGGCIDIGAVETAFDTGNGCLVDTEDVEILVPSFKVFPNPVENYLYLELETPSAELIEIQIVNALGQVIWSENQIENLEQINPIDLRDVEKGIYQIILKGESTIGAKGFVKI